MEKKELNIHDFEWLSPAWDNSQLECAEPFSFEAGDLKLLKIEEITFEDSFGKKFLVLVDGSYLMIENGSEIVYGEAYAIADGHMWKLCNEGESVIWGQGYV